MDVGIPSVIGPQSSSYIALCSHATTLTANFYFAFSGSTTATFGAQDMAITAKVCASSYNSVLPFHQILTATSLR